MGLLVGGEGYIFKAISRHGLNGASLNPASISTILKTLHLGLVDCADINPLRGHSFRVVAALDLLEHGEPLERIMLKVGWPSDSSTIRYLRNLRNYWAI
jgi:hypothetical protein